MYRVMRMYGDSEPWWFLEGWEDDIVSSQDFQEYEVALAYFEEEKASLAQRFPNHKSPTATMISFWSPEDQVWCEECLEHLQYYHSLLLLERDAVLQSMRPDSSHARSCSLKAQ